MAYSAISRFMDYRNWQFSSAQWDTLADLIENGNSAQISFALVNINEIAINDESRMQDAWDIAIDHLEYDGNSFVNTSAAGMIGSMSANYHEQKGQEGLTILTAILQDKANNDNTRAMAGKSIAWIGFASDDFKQQSWGILMALYEETPEDFTVQQGISLMGAKYDDLRDSAGIS